jgi:hypothetical protein
MYAPKIGPKGAKSNGTLYDIKANVEIKPAKIVSKNCILLGKVESITSVSLEKRFTIRPNGVLSKNLMGDRNTLLMAILWKLFDAAAKATERTAPRTLVIKPDDRPQAK